MSGYKPYRLALPCPFCGNNDACLWADVDDTVRVECTRCLVRGPGADTDEEAIALWEKQTVVAMLVDRFFQESESEQIAELRLRDELQCWLTGSFKNRDQAE